MDVDPEDLGVEEDGAHVDLDSQRKGKTNLKYSPLDIRTKLKSHIIFPVLIFNLNNISYVFPLKYRKVCRYQDLNKADLLFTCNWPC